MTVLFDHNVPHKLRAYLHNHTVATADDMGWSGLENGELLNAAEQEGFAVMITCDKNLSYQQNLSGRRLALVVLSLNNWNVLKWHTDEVRAAVDRAQLGSFEVVAIP